MIVSGGAYGSPQLLLLSGLGPAQHLQDMGVPVVQGHAGGRIEPARSFQYQSEPGGAPRPITLNDLENILAEEDQRRRCATRCSARGRWRATAFTPGLFTRSDPRLERPDMQINMFEWSTLERNEDRA